MVAAVMPVPQVLMIGLEGSIPLLSKIALSSRGERNAFVAGSRSSEAGKLIEPGILPERIPEILGVRANRF
jgi:hypothetical protein